MKENDSVDWSKAMWDREELRQFWDPSRQLLKSIRQYQTLKESNNPIDILKTKICVIKHRFWSVCTGAEIDLSCQIGGGLLIPHPNGIVIHPKAKIGVNCLIFQQVTIAGEVDIGFHVDMGAGAKILGPLQIGNSARVGANSVVTKNIAEGQTVVGIPAKVLTS